MFVEIMKTHPRYFNSGSRGDIIAVSSREIHVDPYGALPAFQQHRINLVRISGNYNAVDADDVTVEFRVHF